MILSFEWHLSLRLCDEKRPWWSKSKGYITNRPGDRLTLLGCQWWIHRVVGLCWIGRHRGLHIWGWGWGWSVGHWLVMWVWSQYLLIWWRRRVSLPHKCGCLQRGCACHRLDGCFKNKQTKKFSFLLINIRLLYRNDIHSLAQFMMDPNVTFQVIWKVNRLQVIWGAFETHIHYKHSLQHER